MARIKQVRREWVSLAIQAGPRLANESCLKEVRKGGYNSAGLGFHARRALAMALLSL